MELLVIILELVLHYHLQLLVRHMMIIVMEIFFRLVLYYHLQLAGSAYIYIGAWGYGNSAGSAYIYENDNNGSWNEVSKLIGSDGAAGDRFGKSVSIALPF
eukprot:463136_1